MYGHPRSSRWRTPSRPASRRCFHGSRRWSSGNGAFSSGGPVRVTVLGVPGFEAALGASGAADEGEIEAAQAPLRTLGLLPGGVDLRKIVADADREGVLGFHSSEEGELVVRSGEVSPLLGRTVGVGAA